MNTNETPVKPSKAARWTLPVLGILMSAGMTFAKPPLVEQVQNEAQLARA